MPHTTRIPAFAREPSVLVAVFLATAAGLAGQTGESVATARHVAAAPAGDGPVDVTFSRDVAPILQRACVRCHRDNGVAPMPLVTYEDVQPYASMIARRTQIRDRAGAMPPWYMEKDIGIQHFKDDMSLDEWEIETLDAWRRAGTPRATRPTCRPRSSSTTMSCGRRRAGPDREAPRRAREGRRAPTGGATSRASPRASPRTAG